MFHLNSEPERRVVQAYYDFASFEDVNAPEPGWARMKMASQAFVLPVQIDPFSAIATEQTSTAGSVGSRRNGHDVVVA